jgi:hypothetical protein
MGECVWKIWCIASPPFIWLFIFASPLLFTKQNKIKVWYRALNFCLFIFFTPPLHFMLFRAPPSTFSSEFVISHIPCQFFHPHSLCLFFKCGAGVINKIILPGFVSCKAQFCSQYYRTVFMEFIEGIIPSFLVWACLSVHVLSSIPLPVESIDVL